MSDSFDSASEHDPADADTVLPADGGLLADIGGVPDDGADLGGAGVLGDIADSGAVDPNDVPAAEPALASGAAAGPSYAAASGNSDSAGKFHLTLANFQGPFDLLLQLISSRRLDVTEIALHKVTDEFIAYTKALTASLSGEQGLRADKILDQTTEFLLIAATLLDLKAARLLPSGEVSDEEDLELLEARDLLFARLLQYRAFKQVAELLGELEAAALQRYPRAVSLEERYLELLPEVTLGVDAAGFAEVAATVFRPRPKPRVGLDHIHAHAISIAEQAALVLEMLKNAGVGAWTTFHDICADCEHPIQIVARFLALLELYRGKTIEFDQPDPLGPLSISWIGELADKPAQPVTIEEDYG
ncbi:hypothetical protein NSK11_contig00061-0024 [Nocardia seriolae]|uniref:Segregation and condensation protein A n=1 Tax=Nocardia seriolae TaxID=37332 RepID=A0ABC9YW41_9NOCA|nr:hypothetical protein NSK11_contig00061-0024 [Nocardia seriolae]